jgi:hypothetical protein
MKGCKRSASVQVEEVSVAWEGITRSPRKSVQSLAQHIGVSTSTAWKICCDDAAELTIVERWNNET